MAVVVSVFIAACTGGDPGPGPDTPTGTVEVPPVPDPTALPLAWFMTRPSDLEEELIGEATEALIARCMEDQGFQVPEFPDGSDPIQPLRYWYGLVDLKEARADGYTGLDAAARAAAALDGETEPSETELGESLFPDPARREAYLIALYGPEGDVTRVPVVDPITGEERGLVGVDRGCRGQARAQVFGDADAYLIHQQTVAWLQTVIWEIRLAAKSLEETRQAAEKWLACVADRGFPPEHPFWPTFRRTALDSAEAPDFIGAVPAIGPNWQAFPQPRPSPEEIEMAVADVTCKEESGWTMLVFTEEYRRQDELAAAAAEFIRQGQKIRAEAVERARTILADG
ncbi:MAG: hypothetical protein ACE5F5_00855 [Acidimicrobiia bacterium]